MHTEKPKVPYFGLMAEFEREEDFIEATRKVAAEGYHKLDAYMPYPIHEILDILHLHKNPLPKIVLICGILGCVGGFGMEWFASVIHYPWNIGGKPLYSWPMFMPVAYECTILLAAFGAVFGLIAINGLPRPYHPVFNVPSFERASDDHFFICIESGDPKFDLDKTRKFLEGLRPVSVSTVEH
jgi:hypothetical protein